jgi:hypothetical protein
LNEQSENAESFPMIPNSTNPVSPKNYLNMNIEHNEIENDVKLMDTLGKIWPQTSRNFYTEEGQ